MYWNVLTVEQMIRSSVDNFLYTCLIRSFTHIVLDFIPQITYKDYQSFEATTNQPNQISANLERFIPEPIGRIQISPIISVRISRVKCQPCLWVLNTVKGFSIAILTAVICDWSRVSSSNVRTRKAQYLRTLDSKVQTQLIRYLANLLT